LNPYVQKSEERLVLDDNIDHVKTQVNLALRRLNRRLVDEARHEMERRFYDALKRGELLQLGPSATEIAELVANMAQQLALESGDG
jgi:hypothetical protein